MPVAEPSTSPGRQALLVGLGALATLATIIFLVSRLGTLGGGSAPVEAGSSAFNLGDATELAATIEGDGPLLLPDASGGERDVWLQHLGGEPDQGWRAFAVRPEGSPRDCFANWDAERSEFVDTCNQTAYPANGEGLKQYPVLITTEGTVELNLGVG